ncbi:MAG: 2-oxoglutarate dehydrogenase, E2 component, dihydrolipoamide succinyltransferase, partial [Pseudonocardiales bacterium]|nr:2-oxoglutarate dehydrogenase, E2 component, dihydrolipoamide succinyltransferase [Pseudonocardiales bacterium]
MAFSVQMPPLGESVTEGTVTRWLKNEGDRVEVDEPLLEISTDKVDTEIPSPAAGVLQRIVVGEDETVGVGAELAVIGDGAASDGGDGQAPAAAADAQPAAEPEPEPASVPEPEPEPSTAETSEAEPTAPGSTEVDEQPAAPEPQGATEAPTAGVASDNGASGGTPVTMPALGESVTEGTVVRWLKQVGDVVEIDDPLVEISTDKVDTEIPSPVAGTLLEVTVEEEQVVPVGGQLAVIGAESSAGAASTPTTSAPPPPEPQASPEPEPAETQAVPVPPAPPPP